MRRFFFTNDRSSDDEVLLSTEESHHIRRVLRLIPGDTIELISGQGHVFKAKILDYSKNILVKIICQEKHQEKPSGVVIGQALIKSKKMEFALQKCTELGVDALHPFLAARSQGNLLEQFANKQQRWQKIIDEACKQCGRARPMVLHAVNNFPEILQSKNEVDKQLKILFWEKEKDTNILSLANEIQTTNSVQLLFGPEGGFTDEEVVVARSNGYRTVTLGRSVLRAETAVIVATSIVQHYLGNI